MHQNMIVTQKMEKDGFQFKTAEPLENCALRKWVGESFFLFPVQIIKVPLK